MQVRADDKLPLGCTQWTRRAAPALALNPALITLGTHRLCEVRGTVGLVRRLSRDQDLGVMNARSMAPGF